MGGLLALLLATDSQLVGKYSMTGVIAVGTLSDDY